MKRDLENFEDFIKHNADNLRMKAPERVWKNLAKELNKGRRRFGIGLSAFFLVAAVLGYLTISNTTHPLRQVAIPSAQQNSTAVNRSAETKLSITKGTAVPFQQEERRGKISLPGQINISLPEAAISIAEATQQTSLPAQAEFVPTIVDSHPDTKADSPAAAQRSSFAFSSAPHATSPWTIESVVNSFLQKSKKKESRFQTQYYFAPTISYRKLSENKSYLRKSPQSFATANYNVMYNSVNNMVTHKPAIGFELGVAEKYALSQKIRIRAGLQFNMNRYDIKAFEVPYAVATITLNNRRSARVDSLYTVANYSNVDASRSNKGSWLQNYSFQVSAPVGVEMSLKGNDKMQFGIATSVQPTYVLGDRAYLITSDYKNYTQVPWLLRRWNVNTALETFVSYQSGRTRWQVGPQVRYQLLSSFITNYPVKENLFDFGLKIGVSVIK